ncbi:TIGR02266 family protein [Corallococcus llansteffanensis]|uniref:TIGR02266 family protein n=1 Tax=Corallococcus llansteffanensis TaxID=2316731 RepID=A0A3A8PNM0_9BACT|nr:TIGR02266 family protein [Corallococcus llansteffanensis]RKH57966.1 TIGR02266 family protein [Corallococcus llansteffanensis]
MEGLGALLPSAQSMQLLVAFRDEEGALEVKVEVPGYPRAAVERLGEEVRKSGGSFVELWRLPKAERDALRARTLAGGTPFTGDERTQAAQELRQHLEALSARGPLPSVPLPLFTPAPEAPPTSPRGSGEPYRAPDDASPESSQETPQRRGRRFAVKLELEFRTELDFVREHALNISNGGLFVRTAHRPPQDSVVTVDVKLPNGQRLQGEALVVHVVDAPYTGGVGLAFLSDDATFAGTLDGYLASLVGDKA